MSVLYHIKRFEAHQVLSNKLMEITIIYTLHRYMIIKALKGFLVKTDNVTKGPRYSEYNKRQRPFEYYNVVYLKPFFSNSIGDIWFFKKNCQNFFFLNAKLLGNVLPYSSWTA